MPLLIRNYEPRKHESFEKHEKLFSVFHIFRVFVVHNPCLFAAEKK